MRRLDYLHGLGVTAIWLMPFQPSPGRDDGYDISDYYGVDPRYGTLGDFVEFTHGCQAARHARDHRPRRQPHLRPAPLVPGGARATRIRRYRDWYVWSEKKPANANKGMVFPGVQKSTWTLRQGSRRLVLPPLLRFPARPQHVEPAGAGRDPEDHGLLDPARRLRLPHGRRAVRDRDQGRRRSSKPVEQYDMLRAFREFLQWRAGRRHHPGRGQRAARDRHGVLRRRRRPHAHDVQLPGQPASVLRAGLRPTRGRWRRRWRRPSRGRPPRNGACSCAITTSSISAGSPRRSAQTVFAAFGPDEGHAALRPRHPPPARADAGRRPAAARAGLQPDVHAAGHAGASATATRSAWATISACPSATARARRCSGRPSRTPASPRATSPCVPVIDEGPYGYEHVNVAEQRRDPNSLLNWTERIIRMRKEVPEIGWGDFEVLADRAIPRCSSMRYDWRNNSVLFVHNLAEQPREISFCRRACRRERQTAGQPARPRTTATPTSDGRHTSAARRLRLPLVSRRRARLSAQAQRHRRDHDGQGGASGVSDIAPLILGIAGKFGHFRAADIGQQRGL